MRTIVNERKLGVSELISEGFKIFFFRIRDFSLLALGSIFPTTLLLVLASDEFPSRNAAANDVKIFLLCLTLVLLVVVGLITTMSSAIITEHVVENKSVSLSDAFKLAASKWGRAFATQILTSLILLGLTLLLVIPAVIYSIYYVFVLYAVALRDKNGMEALKYSKSLVEGQWWRIFGISLGIGIVFSIINGSITFLLGLISDDPSFAIIPSVISLYISSIFGVVNAVLFLNTDFVHHRRLVKRKEMEKAGRTKKARSIEEYLRETRRARTALAKRSTVTKVSRKSEKTKTAAKRSTRKKE